MSSGKVVDIWVSTGVKSTPSTWSLQAFCSFWNDSSVWTLKLAFEIIELKRNGTQFHGCLRSVKH